VLPSRIAAGVCVAIVALAPARAQEPDLFQALDQTVAAAEQSLRDGERQIAESRYRTALMQAWMILGALQLGAGRLPDARHAFEQASSSAVANATAAQSLALVQLQMGDTATALETLTKMTSALPRDVGVRRTLAQALVAAGRPAEAVQELEEARAMSPDDPEIAFALASGYLRIKKVESADALFKLVATARPLPETHVLIGRTYRDFGLYDRARASLRTALEMDPRARRAHYYLGTAAVMEEGVVRLDEAIAEFRAELKIAPGDPAASMRLAMAYVEARRHQEALPLLEQAVRGPAASPDAWLYLGRCQLGLGRAADAVASLERALDTPAAGRASSRVRSIEEARLRTVHYQLAVALRETGKSSEAERHFAEAQRLSARRTDADREHLAQYMADAGETAAGDVIPMAAGALDSATAEERAAAEARIRTTLARTYLNLGVMLAQSDRFARAADLFEKAAAIDPAFPQVQYSLGIAHFNARQYDKAAAALTRTLEQRPGNAEARRMLAMASLNAEQYDRAAELLRDDPQRQTDPKLQYAYGLALVRSKRAEEAEQVFSKILADHPDVPELNVVLGQAYAAQDDYESAVTSLKRALDLNRQVAEANATLGLIYLKQGNLPDAIAALRAELAAHPDDVRARYTLATALDLDSQTAEALTQLRTIVAANPAHADARYLFGKILLAQGQAADAAAQLEAAARLAPGDANVHYQLGQAYQRMGRTELAAQAFEAYKKLKDKQRGGVP
jgi:tetratricopeptide (TPR) repeat protein